MKIEGALFAFFAAFFLVVTVVYWLLSGEWTGTVCLALTMLLAFMIGFYLLATARRMELRPEDRPDALISEGTGEVGFFPPHSWMPISLAVGFGLTALGVVFGLFLFLIGLVAVMAAAFGFLFEFYLGLNRTQGQTLGSLRALGEEPTSSRKFLA